MKILILSSIAALFLLIIFSSLKFKNELIEINKKSVHMENLLLLISQDIDVLSKISKQSKALNKNIDIIITNEKGEPMEVKK